MGGKFEDLFVFLDRASALAGIVCLPLVAASLVVRFRRSVGTERAQLKWFAAAAAPIGPAYAVGLLTGSATTEPAMTIGNIAFLIVFVGLSLLPVAIGIAVLRYRLYEIDRIISRTISYALVTAVLVIVFGAAIVLLQEVLAPFTGGNTIAVAVSTLLAATLFQPLRRRVQAAVDRRFNRTRYDAARIEAVLRRPTSGPGRLSDSARGPRRHSDGVGSPVERQRLGPLDQMTNEGPRPPG